MKPTEPLPLFHSWLIFDVDRHFDLGWMSDTPALVPTNSIMLPFDEELLARHAIGTWECDLKDNGLTWSNEVYDLFGLPRGADLSRAEVAAQYCEESRAAMERLRAYAIKHRRGFTLDAEIRPLGGARRWMRLIAAPVCIDDRVVRLVGLKCDVTDRYRP